VRFACSSTTAFGEISQLAWWAMAGLERGACCVDDFDGYVCNDAVCYGEPGGNTTLLCAIWL